jgi:hypothetical protein
MIGFRKQYDIISKVYQSYVNGKKSTKVRFSQEDMEYSKMLYNYKVFENYTIENFISVLIYIIFEYKPPSKTNFLQLLNTVKKEKLLEAIKFKNKILNYNITKKNDFKKISNIEESERNFIEVYELYKNKEISIIGLYEYCKENECKGRILKKELKIFKVLLEFFNIEKDQNEDSK